METIDHTQARKFLDMRRIDLSEDDFRLLQEHLSTCVECRRYAASLDEDDLEKRLRNVFHDRWDAAKPVKSQSGDILIQWGRSMAHARVYSVVGTLVGVLAIIGLVIGLNFIIRNLRPQPAAQPPAPTATYAPLVDLPSPTGIVSTSVSTIPSVTPVPAGTIVLNMGYAVLPIDTQPYSYSNQLAQELSATSGLIVVPVPGPSTNMEILEALRDDRIQMAELDSLAFIYGQSQGWVIPGPVVNFPHTPSGSIMFVARTDSGLVKGGPPQVFQQLAGKHPCWPDINQGWHMSRPPIYEYVLPRGLLAEAGVQLGEPVYVTYSDSHRDNATEVFLKECDFAVVQAIPEEYYLMQWAPYLGSLGFTIDDWATQMQVLYTTPELEPYRIMAFSSQLETSKRDLLTSAILQNPKRDEYSTWEAYDDTQASFFDGFQTLVSASGVDVAEYLSRIWDEYLLSQIASTQTRSPTPEPTNPPSTRTLTICMGAEPDSLDFYRNDMLAQSNILEAIYDGPIDSNGFSYQPVILEKLPSLADGDAATKPVTVKENDLVVNDSGEVVQLKPDQVVRPYGCNLSTCAITWHGGPLEMVQMSATFTLIPGIRWSDGEPLTADDSVFGFEVAATCRTQENPNMSCGILGAGGRITMSRTASYIALDEYTTQWAGLPGFIDQTYMTNFAHPLPRHQAQNYTPEQFWEILAKKPMGWGAYQIDQWKPGIDIRLSKNPYYFRLNQGLPHFEQLIFRFFSRDENQLVAAIQSGECDMLDQEASKSISLSKLIESGESGQIRALTSTANTWEHLDFNMMPSGSILNNGAFASWDVDGDGLGPFGDVRLRQAITMCIDRQKVVDTLFYGVSFVPDSYIPPAHPLFNKEITHWDYDPAAAGKLLDEIGWKDTDHDRTTPRVASAVTGVPDGTPLSFNIETTDTAIRQAVFTIISQNLAGCGISIAQKIYSATDLLNLVPEGRVAGRLFDMAEFAWMTGITPPCNLFLTNQIPASENNWSGQNSPGFSNPAFDDACNLQRQSIPGQENYTNGAKEAQRIFAEQLPLIPLFYRLKTAAARPDMCGYSLDPSSNSDLWNIEAFDYGPDCN